MRFRPLLSLLPFYLSLALPLSATAQSADDDWSAVLELNAPPMQPAKTREEARAVALAHLSRQEAALQRFLAKHPSDPRSIDAQLRLAHLYAMRADFTGSSADTERSNELLANMARSVPESRQPDVAFARLSLSMRGIAAPTDKERREVSDAIHRFQHAYPNDRRIAPLLAELANLYDHQPRQKERYLNQALRAARTDEMRARILDDLKRLSFLGKPIPLEGKTPDGRPLSIADLKGRVVLVYFVASWSPPSIAGMEEINYLRSLFPESRVAVIGVSLDQTPESLKATLSRASGKWLWIHEPRGWESPMIRNLGLNALPLLWIVDAKGNLRTVNARTESESFIQTLLRTP